MDRVKFHLKFRRNFGLERNPSQRLLQGKLHRQATWVNLGCHATVRVPNVGAINVFLPQFRTPSLDRRTLIYNYRDPAETDIELRSNIGRTHTILVQADDCRVSLLLFPWTLMHAARKAKEVRLLSPAICAEPNDPAQETSLAKRPLSLVPVPKC